MKSCSLSILFHGVMVLSCVLAGVANGAAKPSFTLKPAPAWTRAVEVNISHQPSDRSSSILLNDQEVRLSAGNVERFYRHAERVEKVAGLEEVSKLQFDFEPSYQSLVIHFIRIIRGDQTINALRPAEIKIIQKEEELNHQLYDGTMEAVAFLNDVRIGDVVDYAYSVTGDNPVFNGRFSGRFYLADSEPVNALRVRILGPGDRSLHFVDMGTKVQPKITALGNETEYLWEQSEVPAVDVEDSSPTWFTQAPFVAVSEFQDWPAVVQWALPLYQVNEPVAPEVKALADVWTNQFPRPEQRMIAALRFVQQQIRYLGIELGSYSHQPNPPSRTLVRRFGDCKDKSLLLTAFLNYLHIDNAIALANPEARHAIDDWQPSPQAFDHVIVQARIGGRTYWLDATDDSQRGDCEHYFDLPYERALVLRKETRGLEIIPGPKIDSPTSLIREHYAVKSYQAPVSLTVTSSYAGPDADVQRQRWANNSSAEMGRLFLNYYAQDFPSIKADGPPQIRDDADSDTIVVTERYVIDSLWKGQNHYFRGNLVYGELPVPSISKRSMPLAISHPTFMKQIIEIELPSPSGFAAQSEVISDDAFRFEYSYVPSGAAETLSYTLQTLNDNVPPQKVAGYLAKVDRIRNATSLPFPRGTIVQRPGPGLSRAEGFQVLAVVVTVAVILGAFGFVRLRRRREEAARLSSHRPTLGGAPDTAVRCKELSDIETFSRRFQCHCGGYPFKPDALFSQETLVYDGERLATLKLKCHACGRATDLYFVKPVSPEMPRPSLDPAS